jgi:hypothetical protein
MSTADMKSGEGKEGDVESLMNSLRFEQEKNEILLNEVVALEDELVNRELQEFGDVISNASEDFWRGQLISNRESALVALGELKDAKSQGAGAKRPLHNRSLSRPVPRRGLVGEGSVQANAGSADGRAVRIRNRAQELSKAEGIPFSRAFERAEKEICEEGR